MSGNNSTFKRMLYEIWLGMHAYHTTAPINSGNSGGPLLNYQCQVVGIVTAIIQDSQGIGFAIPSDTILENIEELI